MKSPGTVTAANGMVGSSKVYITGSMTMPAHPWMRFWGHTSGVRPVMKCLCRAWSFSKSGWGANEGRFLRNPVASLYMMRWSMVEGLRTRRGKL